MGSLRKKKDVVFLFGGLGNQMFQYAFYLSTLNNNNVDYDVSLLRFYNGHNGFELYRAFKILPRKNLFRLLVYRMASKLDFSLLKKIMGVEVIKDSVPSLYMPWLLKRNNSVTFYWGYWQTEKYFAAIRNVVLSHFSFDSDLLSKESSNILNEIRNTTNSVSIHVRRGDYLTDENDIIYGNICTVEYYLKAIEKVVHLIGESIFFVFSNDIEWTKNCLDIPNPIFIDCNQGINSWQDMFLMSQCNHNIIANSTFSWWGAWLNRSLDKIVISPSRFINSYLDSDIIPDNWLKIE